MPRCFVLGVSGNDLFVLGPFHKTTIVALLVFSLFHCLFYSLAFCGMWLFSYTRENYFAMLYIIDYRLELYG